MSCFPKRFYVKKLSQMISKQIYRYSTNYNDISKDVKQFGILICGSPPNVFTRFGDYGDMMINMLGNMESIKNGNEIWHKYKTLNNVLPNTDELSILDGIVITGSASDAHAYDENWINNLRCFIQKLYYDNRVKVRYNFKVLGICFGHQIICNALNKGSTGRNDNNLYEIGGVKLNLLDNFFDYFNIKNSNQNLFNTNKKECYLLQLHRDCVKSVPYGTKILATSQNTKYEMYAIPPSLTNGMNIRIYMHKIYGNIQI